MWGRSGLRAPGRSFEGARSEGRRELRVGIRSSREKKFRGRPTGEDERRWCILSIARRGEARRAGAEREGVSFKLEIASSAAMMGRKLGAKLNARERSTADEVGGGGRRR